MRRLQYRNFGTHEVLVTNQSVNAGGGKSGVRWYELRKNSGPWAGYQQGTFSPDSHHRWMGSIAMDGSGNMALGYSVSSSSVFPSIGYTGRMASDPLGTMPQGETALIMGTGSQTSSSRWGDYSAMSVDPEDDCTFWYTQQYTVSGGTWRTRIASFSFPGCGGPGPTWDFCLKDVLYATEYWMSLESVRLIRGQALLASTPGFPAPITGQYDPVANEATFSVDYLDQTGLRFYRVNAGTLTGESWGILDSNSSYYDPPRSATLVPCGPTSSESAQGETGAMK
jgi:hypothetical protein